MSDETTVAAGPTARLEEELARVAARLEEELARGRALRQAVRSLGKSDLLAQPRKLAAKLAALDRKLPPEAWAAAGLGELRARLEAWVREGARELRRELLRRLAEACRRRGLTVTRQAGTDEVELRLPPLSLVLDFPRGKGVFRFAREPLAETPLEVERILKTYDRTVAALGGKGPFDPAAFFQTLREAYRLALFRQGGREGDRVELAEFLPFLALLRQPRPFRRRLDRKSYRPYTRAHFAYDLLRLRRAGGFVQGGWRLNLGVATGNSAYRKDRVVWCEDEHGRGEYKLTLFFTRAEGRG